MTTLKIEFKNEAAANNFALWLCGQGEQDYWDWMEYREEKEEGDITATRFHYHGPSGQDQFLSDSTIRTTVGRLDADDD